MDWYDPENSDYDYACYPFHLQVLESRNGPGVDDSEPSAFHHPIEHEIECYEQRGYISGPIKLVARYPDPFAGMTAKNEGVEMLPTVADAEFVDIEVGDAKGVVFVERTPVLQSLAKSQVVRELRLSMFGGAGIPRMTARRLLRRIHLETGVPVYLLVDNDTWGYFFYSLLLRGAIGPHAYFPWAAIENVTLVGIRTGDISNIDIPKSAMRPWRHSWSLRVAAMRQYPCFQSAEWQQDLHEFEKQNCAVNLDDFVTAAGGADVFARDYIAPRL